MHFQIYIPERSGQSERNLIDVGLADFLPGVNWLDVPDGPDAGSGCLAAWPTPQAPEIGYLPDRQCWEPAVAHDGLEAGRYWIGFWKPPASQDGCDTRLDPTPAELKRLYQYRGRSYRLGDGHDWLLPEPQQLTADLILGDDGTWKYETQRRFHAFVNRCYDWMQFFEERGADAPIDFGRIADFLLDALRINYRVTPEVSNRLRLINTDNASTPFMAATGLLGRYERMQSELAGAGAPGP